MADAETQQLIAIARQRGLTVETDDLIAEAQRRGIQIDQSTLEPAGTTTNIARQLGQGLTFGFADEIEAGLRAPFSEEDYGDLVSRIRAENTAYEAENPMASFGLQLGAGALTGGLGAGRAAAMKAVQAVPKLARMAGGGAAAGATAGVGYAEEDVASGAATGALTGAAGGLALPAVVGAVKKFGKPVAQFLMDRLGSSPQQVAQRKVLNALKRDDLTPQQAIARLNELGEAATLADVSPNLTGLAEAVVQRPGTPVKTAVERFSVRREGQGGRILDALDEAVGPVSTRSIDAIEQGGGFQDALRQNVTIDKGLTEFLKRPSMEVAWRKAQRLAKEQGQTLPPLKKVIKAAKDEPMQLQTQVMHWLKKGLDDVAEPKRDPITGMVQTKYGANELRAINQTRRDFRDVVKERNPDYAQQLERVAVGKRIEAAYDQGRDFRKLRRKEDVQKYMKRLNPEETQEFRRGVRDEFEAMLAKVAETGGDASKKVLGFADHLRTVYGPEKGNRLINTLQNELHLMRSEGRILSGSQTAHRLAQREALEGAEGGVGLMGDMISQTGRGLTFGANPISALLGSAISGVRRAGIPDKAVDAIGDTLFQPGPAAQKELAALLAAKGQLPQISSQLSPALISSLLGQTQRPFEQ